MLNCDTFVLAVHDQLQKHWVQRRVKMRDSWVTLPLASGAHLVPINETLVKPGWQEHLESSIRGRYVGSKHWRSRSADVLSMIHAVDSHNLADINQALLNLILNATHAITEAAATGRGRGTLAIRTRTESAPDGPHTAAVIEIQDSGTGIPDHITDRIFDQFFTTKPIGTGTGQGLPLAHTLIHDRHHGTLTFTTTPGTGTTFTIRLPLRPEIPPSSGQPD
jgi:signal transduction histidine kinase